MINLNNPLVIISAKVLGIGLSLDLVREEKKYTLCLSVEAVTWSWCKVWGA